MSGARITTQCFVCESDLTTTDHDEAVAFNKVHDHADVRALVGVLGKAVPRLLNADEMLMIAKAVIADGWARS